MACKYPHSFPIEANGRSEAKISGTSFRVNLWKLLHREEENTRTYLILVIGRIASSIAVYGNKPKQTSGVFKKNTGSLVK